MDWRSKAVGTQTRDRPNGGLEVSEQRPGIGGRGHGNDVAALAVGDDQQAGVVG